MNVVAFNGSPAGNHSATNRMLEAFLEGARQAGAQVQNIQLVDYRIEQCKGCFACWFQSPGRCVLADDMRPLLEAYRSADIVCFGSPVFSWNMTGLLKNFTDRLVPLKSPLITEEQGHFDMEDTDTRRRQQQYVVVSNCGFPGEHNFEVIKVAFSVCNPTLEIYRNCGKLLKSKQAAVQPLVQEYLLAVRQAGYELVQDGAVCSATLEALNRPLMTIPEYVKFLGMG